MSFADILIFQLVQEKIDFDRMALNRIKKALLSGQINLEESTKIKKELGLID